MSAERIAHLHRIRDLTPGLAASAQRTRLLLALRELGKVTTFEASRYLDIYDPRARKMELVKDGHEIVTFRRTVCTESGVTHRIGVYMLWKRAGQ